MKVEVFKIVGVADEKTWAQVHDFLPEDGKLLSYGRLIVALEFEALKEVDISSFGMEIITRLQEAYYSNESESISRKVLQTMESLAAEFLTDVSLKIVMTVLISRDQKRYLYAGRSGGEDVKGGQVYLSRDGELVGLLDDEVESSQVVSGELMASDGFMVGTRKFFELVGHDLVRSTLSDQKIEEGVDGLAAVIQGKEGSSQAAGLVARVPLGEDIVLSEETEGLKDEAEKSLPKALYSGQAQHKLKQIDGQVKKSELKNKVVEIFRKGKSWWQDRVDKKEVFLDKGNTGKQKSAATIAGVLILVFVVSLVLSGRKKDKTRIEMEHQSLIEEINYKYDEAESLLKLNPLRAKSLLIESKEKIDFYSQENENESQELKDWLSKIETSLALVSREYRQETATEWFDFSLAKEGFRGSDWESEENKVLVWDEQGKTVVEIDLESKSSKVVIGGDGVSGSKLVGLAGERGMLIDVDEVKVFDSGEDGEGEVLAQVASDEWGEIRDMVGFSSNLYLLDGSSEGQIWKYLGVNDGLSAKRSYLTGDSYDMSEARSMAIDGSIWVLFSDGTIAKYVRGVKDSFVVAGLDQPFNDPTKIFTSPETENLYVLDKQATRVVVISKTGEYRAQYIWPGMAGAVDLVVSEELGKIYLLTGEKVFVVELR